MKRLLIAMCFVGSLSAQKLAAPPLNSKVPPVSKNAEMLSESVPPSSPPPTGPTLESEQMALRGCAQNASIDNAQSLERIAALTQQLQYWQQKAHIAEAALTSSVEHKSHDKHDDKP